MLINVEKNKTFLFLTPSTLNIYDSTINFLFKYLIIFCMNYTATRWLSFHTKYWTLQGLWTKNFTVRRHELFFFILNFYYELIRNFVWADNITFGGDITAFKRLVQYVTVNIPNYGYFIVAYITAQSSAPIYIHFTDVLQRLVASFGHGARVHTIGDFNSPLGWVPSHNPACPWFEYKNISQRRRIVGQHHFERCIEAIMQNLNLFQISNVMYHTNSSAQN